MCWVLLRQWTMRLAISPNSKCLRMDLSISQISGRWRQQFCELVLAALRALVTKSFTKPMAWHRENRVVRILNRFDSSNYCKEVQPIFFWIFWQSSVQPKMTMSNLMTSYMFPAWTTWSSGLRSSWVGMFVHDLGVLVGKQPQNTAHQHTLTS